MRIVVDRNKCTGLGICESLASDVFEVDDNGVLNLLTETVSTADFEDVDSAVAACPTEALRIER